MRLRGRDWGLKRFDGDQGIAQREENNFFFFLIKGEEKLIWDLGKMFKAKFVFLV